MSESIQTVDGKFSCEQCGKQYSWKPQIAGKKAKCPCGATVIVPTERPGADADLYDFEPTPVVEPVRAVALAAPLPVSTKGPAAGLMVGYRSAATAQDRKRDRFSFDQMTHPPRDVYLPVGLLVGGFLAMVVWAAVGIGAGATLTAGIALIVGFSTLVKTAVLVVLAILIAPKLGISFGTLWTAILKFAAIIIFTDAVLLWVELIMERTGAGSSLTVNLLLTAALVSFLSRFLFDMDAQETATFAVPLALLSRLTGFILKVLAMVILGAIAGVQAPATTPAPNTSSGTSSPSMPASGPPNGAAGGLAAAVRPLSARDLDIERRIKRPYFSQEGRYWNERSAIRSERLYDFVEGLYRAGAAKVYFDMEGTRTGRPVKAYVRLPEGPDARAACIKLLASSLPDSKLMDAVDPLADDGERYLTVQFKQ